MNMPTPQQEGFYRELARLCDLIVLYNGEISSQRRALGWDIRPEGYRFLFRHSLSNTDQRLISSADFHFLTGLPGSLENVMRVFSVTDSSRLAIQSEMRIPVMQTARRRFQSWAFSLLLRKKQIAVCGIGIKMRQYFERLRIQPHRIFPFAYFTSPPWTQGASWSGDVLFVGELVPRKGVDILISAFSQSSKCKDRRLLIAGAGSARAALEDIADHLGVRTRVSFLGALSHTRVTEVMQQASVLVLPSRFDGWGFVVNEALSIGLPVIVTDQCGVAEVVHHNGGGCVVPSEDVGALASALDELLFSEHRWRQEASNAIRAGTLISAENGARYFLAMVDHIMHNCQTRPPRAPWLASTVGLRP
jgi:glycosyltransferase involved in cell wall biosynthesis